MLYAYLFICVSMIIFNIVTAIVLKHKDRKSYRVSEGFRREVSVQLETVKDGGEIDEKHRSRLFRKLKRVGNMIAFDKMLEKVYETDNAAVKKYLYCLDGEFIALTAYYCRRDKIEAAYFPYIIKKYGLIANRCMPSIVGILFKLLNEPNIYCRENALEALYTTGNPDYILKAVRIIDGSGQFFHGKLLADGLLSYLGDASELGDRFASELDTFSDEMKVTLLNYLRFSSGRYCELMYKIMCDESENDEVRYAAVRYFGKYPFDGAYKKLVSLADSKSSERWEYAAIASTVLGSYPCDETVELLKNNLYSRNWYVRLNSARSLEHMGITYIELVDVIDGSDRYASEILRYCLNDSMTDNGRAKGEKVPV